MTVIPRKIARPQTSVERTGKDLRQLRVVKPKAVSDLELSYKFTPGQGLETGKAEHQTIEHICRVPGLASLRLNPKLRPAASYSQGTVSAWGTPRRGPQPFHFQPLILRLSGRDPCVFYSSCVRIRM